VPGETRNHLSGFPAYFIGAVRWRTGRSHLIGTLTRQSNFLFISQGRTPRDNENLSVKSKSIEPEYLIANMPRKNVDTVLNQSKARVRNGHRRLRLRWFHSLSSYRFARMEL